jgi:hypothetical protein
VSSNERAWFIHGVKYPEFKLFWMSVLRRMGISSLDLFSPVDLGPDAEAIRQRLEAEDPGGPLVYPTMFLAPLRIPKPILGSIMPPEPLRLLGFHGYRWFVGGLIVVFLVDQRPVNEEARDAVLNQRGELPILKDVDGSSAPLMRQMIEKIWRLAQVHREPTGVGAPGAARHAWCSGAMTSGSGGILPHRWHLW